MRDHVKWLRTLPMGELTQDMYIDDLRTRRGKTTAHMMCPDVDELHEFARRLGITRWQYHEHKRHPHYDITRSQWERIRAMDVNHVNSREMLDACSQEVLP